MSANQQSPLAHHFHDLGQQHETNTLGMWLFLATELMVFGALFTGTSTRSLDPSVFPPELAGNLALMIQALVLLFVGADLLILYIWQARRKLRLPGTADAAKGPA